MHLLAIKLLCFMAARSVVRKVTCDVGNNAHNITRRRRSTEFVPVNTIKQHYIPLWTEETVTCIAITPKQNAH